MTLQLKTTILDILTRDDLKQIVDDLGIDGVDRRSVEAMRSALRRARRAKPEDLLGYLRKDQMGPEGIQDVWLSSQAGSVSPGLGVTLRSFDLPSLWRSW